MFATVLLAILACGPAEAAEGPGPSPDYPALGREVVKTVRDQFLDAGRAAAWAERNADYAANVRDGADFALRTNEALAELATSHTQYYPRGTASYWGLLAIFGSTLEAGPVAYDSIGADVSDRHFVRRVLAGGPAARAGVLRGDRLVAVDGKPYDPVGPFDGKAGRPVELTVERAAGGPPHTLWVTPNRVDPKIEWVTAMDEGARLFARDGVDVAYVPVPWCVGEEVAELMRDMIAVRFSDADALVLDFRDGWGGCNPDFLNHFNAAPPVMTLIDREGARRSYDPQWRKPLYFLINGGSRSGKEVIAHAVRRQGLGTLVGSRTAGFVVGGRPFLLSDESVLYLAVMDVLVDGERLEGVGVMPHIDVPDRLEYAAGADPQLERAIDDAVERLRPGAP